MKRGGSNGLLIFAENESLFFAFLFLFLSLFLCIIIILINRYYIGFIIFSFSVSGWAFGLRRKKKRDKTSLTIYPFFCTFVEFLCWQFLPEMVTERALSGGVGNVTLA